jgi:20S proteasome subunit alpha 4
MSYDRAVTVFSPDGHLFQVEYAGEAVKKGLSAVGVKGKDTVVLAVEKKSVAQLQDNRTVRKIMKVDDHIFLAFAGMSADARVLVQKAQLQAQVFKLSYDDPMDVDFLVRYVAELQQKSTQKGGSRPYGVATIIGGFNQDGTPHLWQTEPSGMSASWSACTIGKSSKSILEEMQKHYKPDMSRDDAVKFAVRALMESVESGSKNMEMVVLQQGAATFASADEINALHKELEVERDATRAKKRAAMADE